MTPREIVLEQIHHRPTKPVPYTITFEGDTAERITRYYGTDSWLTKLIPYIVDCCAIDRRREVSIGDHRTRDIFGSIWRIDKRPFHLESPGLPVPSFDEYNFPKAEDFIDPEMKTKALENLKKQSDSFNVIGVGWGLWESCWGIRGFDNALMDCAAEPQFFGELLDHLTQLYLDQIALCADIPADAFMFGDDWGDQRGIMMGPERWRRFFKPRYARIYEAAHAQGKIVISHCCGSMVDIMPDAIEIGLDVLESVQPEARGMNPYELKKNWGEKITFWGCLGSQSTIPFGTPQAIHEEVCQLRRRIGAGGGFILGPAKALQPETPTENAVAVVEAFMSE